MSKFRNAHTAAIDTTAPGQIGDFDPDNPAVRKLVRAGKLVPAEGSLRANGDASTLDAAERFDRAWAERAEEHRRELATREARITELEVELAQARLDLEAARAAKPDAAPPKGDDKGAKGTAQRSG